MNNLSVNGIEKAWRQFVDEKWNSVKCKEELTLIYDWNQWLNDNYGITVGAGDTYYYDGDLIIHDPHKYTLFLLKYS